MTKAAGDAVALLEALSHCNDIPSALKAYERPRVEFGRFIVAHARAPGAYMQAQLHSEHEREMAERYRTPAAIMKETAVSPKHH